ncbi:thermonuclease family protein [Microbacterium sp. NPDC096154]|uniref:thermonuclease family protein n=1 Tax=Microbacterium sp. NPDC096154 TaxID=3155549 RepID=UPI00332153A1
MGRGSRVVMLLAAVVVVGGVGAVAVSSMRGASAPETQDVPGRPEGAVAMTVEHVYDGDTLSLMGEGGGLERVRLIGVDTPEGPGASGSDEPECGADAARDALRGLAPEGSTLWVAPDREPRDRYDRALLYAWTADGRFVNRELVASGAGEVMVIPPNDAHEELLAAAQQKAQAQGLGIWGSC